MFEFLGGASLQNDGSWEYHGPGGEGEPVPHTDAVPLQWGDNVDLYAVPPGEEDAFVAFCYDELLPARGMGETWVHAVLRDGRRVVVVEWATVSLPLPQEGGRGTGAIGVW